MKITKKQQETVELILRKEKELNKKLYVIYNNLNRKMILMDLINLDEDRITLNEIEQLNGKVCYNLLDKDVLTKFKIGNKDLIGLNENYYQ